MSESTPKKNWIWSDVTTVESAKSAALKGFWACMIVAIVTAIFASLSLVLKKDIASIDSWAYLDAAIFALFAWRIRKMSRIFSVLAVILFIIEKALLAMSQGAAGLPLAIVLLLFFINGVRGTFSYHKLTKQAEISPEPEPA